MSFRNLFSPVANQRQQVTSSASLVTLPPKQEKLQITVEQGSNVLVLFGTSSMSAVQDGNGCPFFADSKEVIDWPVGATHASVKSTSSTSVYVTFSSGDGE